MCIKIVKAKQEVPYDLKKPLEEQIKGSKEIIINYIPNDPSIDKFMDEIERFCSTGISFKLNVKVQHNNSLDGARVNKKIKKSKKDLEINELIKLMAISHAEADRRLEEIANYCLDKVCRKG